MSQYSIELEAMTTNQLELEVKLDTSIGRPEEELKSEFKNIFMTGATGFLGLRVLADMLSSNLIHVTCLARGESVSEVQEKLLANVRSISDGREIFENRLSVVLGDLGCPKLGLSDNDYLHLTTNVDLILHLGAWVNHLFPYSELKQVNVGGTEEILKIASLGCPKRVVYTSTIGVQVARENDTLDHGKILPLGYTQSKWVAEKLIQLAQAKGIPTTVFRPGQVIWDSQSGACNLTQFECILLRASIEMGLMINADSMCKLFPQVAPIDFVVKAITKLSFQRESTGKVFHLIDPNPARWNHIIEAIQKFGFQFETTTIDRWLELIRSQLMPGANGSKNLQLAYALVEGRSQIMKNFSRDRSAHFFSEETMAALGNPQLDYDSNESVGKWLSYMIDQGFLSDPVQKVA